MARRGGKSGDDTAGGERAFRHPRETYRLYGHSGALEALERDIGENRLHHGLLITGNRGIGKATFAYALARRLLTAAQGDAADDPHARTARQIAAGAHPDLLALDGDESAGVTRAISVERVRELVSFFSLTASTGGESGYRIGIVDRADDLNTASANALLKLLEEPPKRAVLMLVCETPGRLPATVRSRCRRVPLAPLETADLDAAVRAAGGVAGASTDSFVERWIGGSVLRALMAGDPAVAKTIAETAALMQQIPGIDQQALSAFAARFGPREARDAFDIVFDVAAMQLAQDARRRAGQAGEGAVRRARCMRSLDDLKREADVLNLDRTRTVLAAFRELTLALDSQP